MPTSGQMLLQGREVFAVLQTFPDIDEMYRQRTLTRLLEKEQWAVAATYAGQDTQCQVTTDILCLLQLAIPCSCPTHRISGLTHGT